MLTLDFIIPALAGVAVIVLSIWLIQRKTVFSRELEEALRIEKSDPERGRLMVDQYFMRGQLREEAERQELWKRADVDLTAAQDLRQRLLNDLESDSLIKQDVGKSANADLKRTIEMSQRGTREQLAKLDGMISRIRGT